MLNKFKLITLVGLCSTGLLFGSNYIPNQWPYSDYNDLTMAPSFEQTSNVYQPFSGSCSEFDVSDALFRGYNALDNDATGDDISAELLFGSDKHSHSPYQWQSSDYVNLPMAPRFEQTSDNCQPYSKPYIVFDLSNVFFYNSKALKNKAKEVILEPTPQKNQTDNSINNPEETNNIYLNEMPCSYCDNNEILYKIKDLRKHIKKNHPGKKPYACNWPGCNKIFKHPQSLNQHKPIHNGTKLECPICFFETYIQYRLKNHMKKHDGTIQKGAVCSDDMGH
ncbi:MAG: hypothetical protein UR26_C0003G0033 [candidate division TM6 bacterium GW2011_GWF2_32_72]|nr:MAG: hypothetical protein UR26_C0003G0033 [candidate division TM6 bacterium GW2011_GWF2_32_72]